MPTYRDLAHRYVKAEAALAALVVAYQTEIAAGRATLDTPISDALLDQAGAIEWACHRVGTTPDPDPTPDPTPAA